MLIILELYALIFWSRPNQDGQIYTQNNYLYLIKGYMRNISSDIQLYFSRGYLGQMQKIKRPCKKVF
jgi:hypothetical protein